MTEITPILGAENKFLHRLLSLQQDGSEAISAPSNWLKEPLLRVETDTLRRVRAFADEVVGCEQPHWLILVGGPGNGKSMAVRELVTRLFRRELVVQDEAGVPVAEMSSYPVPAVLEVRSDAGQLVARIAQDASVVRNPYVEEPNPAQDLRDLFVRCERERVHLIACANRGVLESAAAHGDLDTPVSVTKLLAEMVEAGERAPDGSDDFREVEGVRLLARPMDVGSLFEGSPSVFDQLLDQATSPERWEACNSCELASICPFLLNRNELVGETGRFRVVRLLEDAELLDGQPLVFREASALVSLLLAGSAADYTEGGPCGWVERCASEKAWFRLAARRLHMILFSASAPLGIAEEEQVRELRLLCEQAGLSYESILEGLPSTRVGLPRLFGSNGVMRKLDPLSSPIERGLSEWEDGYTFRCGPSHLEMNCQELWDSLDDALKEDDNDVAVRLHALARWLSSHSLRFGALHGGLHSWRVELDGYREAIGMPKKPGPRERNRLSAMLREVLDSRDGIRVSSNVRVSTRTCGEVGVDWDASASRRSICITLGEEGEVLTKVPPAAFIWLRRRHDAPLHDGTFPGVWLESARDAIARAASASLYSQAPEGEMWVETGDGNQLNLLWGAGEVEVEAPDA